VRQESGNHLERLRRLLVRHVRFVRENQAIPRIILSDEISSRNPARKARVHRIIQTYLDRVADIVRAGQEAGEIRTDVEMNKNQDVIRVAAAIKRFVQTERER